MTEHDTIWQEYRSAGYVWAGLVRRTRGRQKRISPFTFDILMLITCCERSANRFALIILRSPVYSELLKYLRFVSGQMVSKSRWNKSSLIILPVYYRGWILFILFYGHSSSWLSYYLKKRASEKTYIGWHRYRQRFISSFGNSCYYDYLGTLCYGYSSMNPAALTTN